MKRFVIVSFLASFSIFSAQLRNVDIVAFYNWTATNGVHYNLMYISDKMEDVNKENPALIRVKYSLNGGVSTKIVEYNAVTKLSLNPNDSEDIILKIFAAQTARIIEGNNGYSPDNFIFHFNTKGDFVKGYQIDQNEMKKDNANYAKVFQLDFVDSELRGLMKLYYKSTEALYPDLMTYAAQFD